MTLPGCFTLRMRGGWWEDLLSRRCAFPIAPVNTFSNLAYLVAGIAAYLACPTPWGLAVGALFFALALVSGWYHGAKTLVSSRADNAGIYALLTALTLHAAGYASVVPSVVIAAGVAGALAFGPYWKQTLEPAVGVLGVVALACTAARGSLLLAAISVVLTAAAFNAWQMDRQRTFRWPRWGHAVWHVLTAGALLLLFLAAP